MRVFPPKSVRLLLGFILATIVVPNSVRAWDAAGHEVIASLAYDRLNSKARQTVTALARELQNPSGPYDAITLACWMDDLRTPDPAMPCHGLFLGWHYIDLGIESGDPEPSMEPGDDNEMHGNVVQALKRALVVLKGGTDPYIASKAMACAMAMHLVGDIHQPLHAATHYFYAAGGRFRNDAGGNKEEVVNGPAGDPRFNLHAFWDSAYRASFDTDTGCIVLDERLNERGVHDPRKVTALVEEVRKINPPANAGLETDIDAWAHESNAIARDFAYREITSTESRKYCRLSTGYVTRANLIARERLALAAERLAVLLNDTLGVDHPGLPPPAYSAGPPLE